MVGHRKVGHALRTGHCWGTRMRVGTVWAALPPGQAGGCEAGLVGLDHAGFIRGA